jgi:purine nucleosidase
MNHKKVIIDTDPGVDDALALLLALRSPALDVVGITTVAGNMVLDTTTRNALVVVEHSGRQVPVYAGASRPLVEPLETAAHAHGQDGLGDTGFPDPSGVAREEHAVDFTIRTVMDSTDPIHLITVGPLTNIALALTKEPRLEERVESLTMMVGAWSGGNLTQVAEYNAGVDPEATDIAFRSRIPKTMVALDPIRESATILAEDVERLERAGTPWCGMAARLLRPWVERWSLTWVSLCDPAAVAVAIHADVAETEYLPVAIETRGQHTRGMTVADFRRGRGHKLGVMEPNVNVVLRFDSERFRELVMGTFLAQ